MREREREGGRESDSFVHVSMCVSDCCVGLVSQDQMY